MTQRVAAFVGPSGSGKTTLIVEIVRDLCARGASVAVLKHTHHALNEEHRGDTALFRDAGADPVLLVGECEAVEFSDAAAPRRITFPSVEELVGSSIADFILLEGWKSGLGFTTVELQPNLRVGAQEALANLDRIWRS